MISDSEQTSYSQIPFEHDLVHYDFVNQLIKGGFNITNFFFQTRDLMNFNMSICSDPDKELTIVELSNCDHAYQDFLEKAIRQYRLCAIYRLKDHLYPCQKLVLTKLDLSERDLLLEIITRSIQPENDRYRNIINSFRNRRLQIAAMNRNSDQE